MRIAILASLLALFVGAPTLALDLDPVHPDSAIERSLQRGPASRADRWRGKPYARETDEPLREALDRRLIRDADLTLLPTLAEEEDLIRRQALDMLLPLDGPALGGGTLIPGL